MASLTLMRDCAILPISEGSVGGPVRPLRDGACGPGDLVVTASRPILPTSPPPAELSLITSLSKGRRGVRASCGGPRRRTHALRQPQRQRNRAVSAAPAFAG